MVLNYGITLRDYITGLYYGIILRGHITEIYYETILQNHSMEFYHEIIMNCPYQKGSRGSLGPLRSP